MDFVLFITAFCVVFLINAVARRVERERRRVGEAAPSGVSHPLTHYELAYLSGGPRRTINTALTILATAGAVRVSRGSQVTPVYGAPPSPDPIEQAVLDALAARPGGYRAAELRRALETHPALTHLAAGLAGRGLMLGEQAYGPAWRRLDHLKLAVSAAVGYLVLLFVLAFLGLAGKEPFFLGALLFSGFAVLTGFVAIARQRRRLRSVITREGREVLRAARDHHPRGAQDHSSLAFAVGVPVALYGLQNAPDRTLCDELSVGDPASDCAGSCGGHSDSGSGGSTFGSDSYGGLDFGGGGSSGCGGGSSSCGGGSSSCGGGGGCGGGSS